METEQIRQLVGRLSLAAGGFYDDIKGPLRDRMTFCQYRRYESLVESRECQRISRAASILNDQPDRTTYGCFEGPNRLTNFGGNGFGGHMEAIYFFEHFFFGALLAPLWKFLLRAALGAFPGGLAGTAPVSIILCSAAPSTISAGSSFRSLSDGSPGNDETQKHTSPNAFFGQIFECVSKKASTRT